MLVVVVAIVVVGAAATAAVGVVVVLVIVVKVIVADAAAASSAATAATAPTSDAQSSLLCSNAASHNISNGRSDSSGDHQTMSESWFRSVRTIALGFKMSGVLRVGLGFKVTVLGLEFRASAPPR